jgi:mono/diheme cytochrome c family protein
MCAKLSKVIFVVFSSVVVLAIDAIAAPWDQDLFKQQSYKAGEITRAPVTGTVPLGYKPFNLTTDEAEAKLKNPVEFSLDSVWRGQRLWNSNCLTCHGKKGDGQGPVGPQVSAPSLLSDFYRGRGDGRVYGVIVNGGASMPRYGYKFSEQDNWDIVNYLRFLQGREIEGLKRPE